MNAAQLLEEAGNRHLAKIDAMGGMIQYVAHEIFQRVESVGRHQGHRAGLKELSIRLLSSDTEFAAAIECAVQSRLMITFPGKYDFGDDAQGINWKMRILPDPIPRGPGTGRNWPDSTSDNQVARGSMDPPPRSTTGSQRSGFRSQRQPARQLPAERPANFVSRAQSSGNRDQLTGKTIPGRRGQLEWSQGPVEWPDNSWQQGTNEPLGYLWQQGATGLPDEQSVSSRWSDGKSVSSAEPPSLIYSI